MERQRQNDLIVEQFTAQAAPYAEYAPNVDDEALRPVREAAGVGPDDVVLDVACGPGMIAFDLARVAKRVTGVDLTPAMLDQARARQAREGRTNLDWRLCDVHELPFEDGAFSLVVTRFTFHHIPDPLVVLREMARVCRPGGRVVVADVYSRTPDQGAAYDRVEKLRDPSHVHALGLDEFAELFAAARLDADPPVFFGMDVRLDDLLATSAPEAGAADEVRRTFHADLGAGRLGVNAREEAGAIRFTFPLAVFVGRKPKA